MQLNILCITLNCVELSPKLMCVIRYLLMLTPSMYTLFLWNESVKMLFLQVCNFCLLCFFSFHAFVNTFTDTNQQDLEEREK